MSSSSKAAMLHSPTPVLTGSLAEAVRNHAPASSALQLHARENNHGVQRLVTGYELWESSLRSEAQHRLVNGFAPASSSHSLLQPKAPAPSLLPEEWSLLKRVHRQLPGSSIRRAASESNLRSGPDASRVGLDWSAYGPSIPSKQGKAGSSQRHEAHRHMQHPHMPQPSSSSPSSPSTPTNHLSMSLSQPCTPCPSSASIPDPFSGSLAPWSVFPMYLRAREQAMDQQPPSPTTTTSLPSLAPDLAPAPDPASPFDLFTSPAKARGRRCSIRAPGRHFAIITTASLPWLTGTSVNPLLRAAYLSIDPTRRVMLLVPWLSPVDQENVFPVGTRFTTPEAQEAYIRDWARKRTGLDCNFRISFYPGRYAAEKGSILPVGDITEMVRDHEADVAVLEEPEHLNWYHHGRRWTDKFHHVVGIMHTNYLDYARREEGGYMKELILKHINTWVCRIHCHKVIKLSDAVQRLPRQHTMFVHGVSPSFLRVGEQKARQLQAGDAGAGKAFTRGVYFIGKVLWAKGYTELLERMSEHMERTGDNVHVDVYGSGPDLQAVESEAARRQLNLTFNGARDHADHSLQDYKVFVNPSLSDVVATTTAEALAMGKFVVCADHPSNRFFSMFPNCLIYKDSNEFSHCLSSALSRSPQPLSPEDLHSLTWEAATERFLDIADVSEKQPALEMALDSLLHAAHNTLTGIEAMRVLSGAGAKTRDLPARVTDYLPCTEDVGGLFDNHARASKSKAAAAVAINAGGHAKAK